MPRDGQTLRAYMKLRNRAVVLAAKDRPCADCKKKLPYYVMDFDHVRGKKLFGIGDRVRMCTVKQLLTEIKKCEVVCSNCHRTREWMRCQKTQ